MSQSLGSPALQREPWGHSGRRRIPAIRLHPLPTVSPKAARDVKTQDAGPGGLRCMWKGRFFQRAQTLYRKAVNSLTWDIFVVLPSFSHVRLLVTPWTAAHQYSLSFTLSWGLLKLMSNESVRPSNHLLLCLSPISSCLQSFPASGSFPMSQLFVLHTRFIFIKSNLLMFWFPALCCKTSI